jgi:hypothetical protein
MSPIPIGDKMEKSKCYSCSITINISKKKVDGREEIIYTISPFYPMVYNSKPEEIFSDLTAMGAALEKHIKSMSDELD